MTPGPSSLGASDYFHRAHILSISYILTSPHLTCLVAILGQPPRLPGFSSPLIRHRLPDLNHQAKTLRISQWNETLVRWRTSKQKEWRHVFFWPIDVFLKVKYKLIVLVLTSTTDLFDISVRSLKFVHELHRWIQYTFMCNCLHIHADDCMYQGISMCL